jgi:hypothetical protein
VLSELRSPADGLANLVTQLACSASVWLPVSSGKAAVAGSSKADVAGSGGRRVDVPQRGLRGGTRYGACGGGCCWWSGTQRCRSDACGGK